MHSEYTYTKSYTTNRCQEETFITSDSTKLLKSHFSQLILSTIMTLPSLLQTLFLCSCSSEISSTESHQQQAYQIEYPLSDCASYLSIECNSKSLEGLSYLDIFTFNDDELMNLDSYQRLKEISSPEIKVRSQNGDKIVFLCANSQWDKYSWTDINSFASLDNVYADLRKERRDSFLMTGTTRMSTGDHSSIVLNSLVSEVRLRSIRCDFSGKSYEGEYITEACVYLTNVNSLCNITAEGEIKPMQIVNGGRLNKDDLYMFHDQSMIFQTIDSDIGSKREDLEISLFCYPNTSESESPGTPFTRMVIEGKIEGETYWWPINVNRDTDTAAGVLRNCLYIYDITIKKKGTNDPDCAIGKKDIDINLEIKKWEEKEDYAVLF